MNWYLIVLRKYAVFSARTGRKEYGYFLLFHLIIIFGLALTGRALHERFGATARASLATTIGIYMLAEFVPQITESVRRLHDIGRSGWWFLINLIPVLGACWLLILMALNGTPGENKYGPKPKVAAGSSALQGGGQ